MPGAPVAEATFENLEPRIKVLVEHGFTPGLATILVGDDGASAGYIRMKQEKALEVGLTAPHVHLPESATQADLVAAIRDHQVVVVAGGMIPGRHLAVDPVDLVVLRPQPGREPGRHQPAQPLFAQEGRRVGAERTERELPQER